MRLLTILVVLGALGAGGGLAAICLGLPDVAATTPHWKLTEWVLSTTMEKAVERRAAGIPVPGDLSEPARVRAGAGEYDEMCAVCHAAPGVEAASLAEGLLPEPPDLADEIEEWAAAELFWITKHGVRMTGMPGFGPTHDDAELWDIVAFLQRLPELSPTEYRSLVEGARGEQEHDHGGDGASGSGRAHEDEHDHAH